MSEIEEFERRIMAAMDRIAQGVTQLDTQDSGDSSEAVAALEDERLANAQLQERVRKLTERAESAEKQAQDTAIAAAERIEALDVELQRLRKATEQLRESNAALRTANEAGVGEPHLINKAMLAELEALRASRAADVAEADTILTALHGLLQSGEEEQAHA